VFTKARSRYTIARFLQQQSANLRLLFPLINSQDFCLNICQVIAFETSVKFDVLLRKGFPEQLSFADASFKLGKFHGTEELHFLVKVPQIGDI
jgi:hypothetical protein